MSAQRAVTLLGIGADGCRGLSSRAIGAVSRSQVLVGGARQLEFFPEFAGEKITLQGGLAKALGAVSELAEDHTVSILASGDPMFFGVGALVVARVGAEHVDVIPHPSSVQLAFARIGQKWDDAQFFSAHGRPLAGLASRMRTAAKAAVFTDGDNHPARIAQHLIEYGVAKGRLAWVCENLGGPGERVQSFTLEQLGEHTQSSFSELNLLLLTASPAAESGGAPLAQPRAIAFLPEEVFDKRVPKLGLITKQEARLLSLAQLGLTRSSVVWDIGAGSGSVAIEAAMLAPEGKVYAVEVDPEGAELCRVNARRHGTDNVEVICGRAPEAFAGLPAPSAVFVGGSKGSMEAIVKQAAARLPPAGRIVINAITLENIAEAHRSLKVCGLEVDVRLLQVSRSKPLARYLRFEALNPIHIFCGVKGAAREGAPDPSKGGPS